MLNLITITINLFLIVLTGWTFITYFIKKDYRKLIRKELIDLIDSLKKILLSLNNLISTLIRASLSNEETNTPIEEKAVFKEDESTLNPVEPIKEIKDQSVEKLYDDDEALSSFSPEVIDVIKEEEEKVA